MGEEPWIEHPASMYSGDLEHAFFSKLKAKPFALLSVWRPFSLESLKALRMYLLSQHPNASLPYPKQTRGQRSGKKKQWTLQVKDNDSFRQVVGSAFPQNSAFPDSVGTGRLFGASAMTAWVPPLEFVVSSTSQDGSSHSFCQIRMQSARITQYGFDFHRRTKESTQPSVKQFLSLLCFRSQQERLAHIPNSGMADSADAPPPLPAMVPLDHGLLHTALPHARLAISQSAAPAAPPAPARSSAP